MTTNGNYSERAQYRKTPAGSAPIFHIKVCLQDLGSGAADLRRKKKKQSCVRAFVFPDFISGKSPQVI